MENLNTVVAGKTFDKRSFVKTLLLAIAAMFYPRSSGGQEKPGKKRGWVFGNDYSPEEHFWGMAVDVNKCIGCGLCVRGCKEENNVPQYPFFFRTWVERYRVIDDGEVLIESPNGAINSFSSDELDKNVVRSFFVPKLCNHCDNPPCVQVCPVGASFQLEDGVVLVDSDYCVGCSYCIQACPYGARFLHPETKTAEKCTFCYHRIVQDLAPACVEMCPAQARVFGEVKKKASPLVRFIRMNKIAVLKPFLNTEPKVFYANLDMEVK